jgi:predicted HNH restriction endonuclease
LTSEEEKRLLVLAAIAKMGGAGTKKMVLDAIAADNWMQYSEYDLQLRASRKELNWRNDLAFIRSHLVRHQHLSSELNNWTLTESGRVYASTLLSQAFEHNILQHIQASALPLLAQVFDMVSLSDAAALEGETTGFEGKQVQRWVNSYERDSGLRRAAIRIHGTTCMACDFDFGTRYGSLGVGFIEVHHTVPVSSLGGSAPINPADDLVVLCSNCHSIVHRRKGKPLSIAELRSLLSTRSEIRPDS